MNKEDALRYIKNTGGNPTIEWFDDDNAPIGPLLRRDLRVANLIEEIDGKILIKSKPLDK